MIKEIEIQGCITVSEDVSMEHTKYLHVHDWNYWWGYYRCGKDWKPFHGAEFSLTEDEAGEVSFWLA